MKTEGQETRLGTPQAAGVKFEDVVREIQARNCLAVLAGHHFTLTAAQIAQRNKAFDDRACPLFGTPCGVQA